MTAVEVIDDLLSRKLLDWTRDELVAARVCALKGTLPSDEESYWWKVHARLQKTEIEHAAPEDLVQAPVADYYPLTVRAAGGADTECRRSIYDRARAAPVPQTTA